MLSTVIDDDNGVLLSLSTLLKSYKEEVRVIMKDSVLCTAIKS